MSSRVDHLQGKTITALFSLDKIRCLGVSLVALQAKWRVKQMKHNNIKMLSVSREVIADRVTLQESQGKQCRVAHILL